MQEAAPFTEATLGSTPIRDLGLELTGTPLEPVLASFTAELKAAGIVRLQPRFYLSTEWGVPFDTVAIAIPFYLARPDLTALHARRTGHVEGLSRGDILRYLRHEMGHVVNYAYRLYDAAAWVERFGAISQPYLETYRPEPFSRRFVRHLPGWYAQKHPDEDWAETFAVWLTPGLDWRAEYGEWPDALAKLEYCDATLRRLTDQDPLVTNDELDEDVSAIDDSVEHYYAQLGDDTSELPRGLDGALRAIFEDLVDGPAGPTRQPAGALVRRLADVLPAEVYPRRNSPLRSAAARLGLLGAPLAACQLPRDPEHTLERVRGGVLRVGAVHEPPWVRMPHPQGPPAGVEVALVEALAASLDAELRWNYGGEGRLMTALERFELDLVIGGVDGDSPYKDKVGFTRPYYREDEVDHVLAAPPGENAWIMHLEAFLRDQEPGLPPLLAEQRAAGRGAP